MYPKIAKNLPPDQPLMDPKLTKDTPRINQKDSKNTAQVNLTQIRPEMPRMDLN